jgi:hypothetical protein
MIVIAKDKKVEGFVERFLNNKDVPHSALHVSDDLAIVLLVSKEATQRQYEKMVKPVKRGLKQYFNMRLVTTYKEQKFEKLVDYNSPPPTRQQLIKFIEEHFNVQYLDDDIGGRPILKRLTNDVSAVKLAQQIKSFVAEYFAQHLSVIAV